MHIEFTNVSVDADLKILCSMCVFSTHPKTELTVVFCNDKFRDVNVLPELTWSTLLGYGLRLPFALPQCVFFVSELFPRAGCYIREILHNLVIQILPNLNFLSQEQNITQIGRVHKWFTETILIQTHDE